MLQIAASFAVRGKVARDPIEVFPQRRQVPAPVGFRPGTELLDRDGAGWDHFRRIGHRPVRGLVKGAFVEGIVEAVLLAEIPVLLYGARLGPAVRVPRSLSGDPADAQHEAEGQGEQFAGGRGRDRTPEPLNRVTFPGRTALDREAVVYETWCSDPRFDPRFFWPALGGEPFGRSRHASAGVRSDAEMRRNRVSPMPSGAETGRLLGRLLIVR